MGVVFQDGTIPSTEELKRMLHGSAGKASNQVRAQRWPLSSFPDSNGPPRPVPDGSGPFPSRVERPSPVALH